MTYQDRVYEWLLACFGEEISQDKVERNHRFLEEALETVQSGGCTRSEAHQLVDYVFGRPVGELGQEVGGALVCLAALCSAHGRDMAACGEIELTRIWTKVEQIRAKQAAKPKHSPLPEAAHLAAGEAREVDRVRAAAMRLASRTGQQFVIDPERERQFAAQCAASPTPAVTVPPAGAMDAGTVERSRLLDEMQDFLDMNGETHTVSWCDGVAAAIRHFRALGGHANG